MLKNLLFVDLNHILEPSLKDTLRSYQLRSWLPEPQTSLPNHIIDHQIDLVVIGMDGRSDALSFLHEIQEISVFRRPLVVVVSPIQDDYLKVTCLNLGADDFLEWPMNKRYFKAKLQAYERMLGRIRKNEETPVFKIDYDRFSVVHKRKSYSLPKKEFEILNLLSTGKAKVFSREEIKQRVWENPSEVNNRTIDVYIRKIRSRLGGEVIQTVKGVGYRVST